MFGQKAERKIFAVGRHKKLTPICGWRVKPAKWAFNMMIILSWICSQKSGKE